MKILITLATLLVAVNSIDKELVQQIKAKLEEQLRSCAKEVSASADDVTVILSQKIPDSHEGKCIYFCMHKLHNAQNEDGTLNMAGALETLDLLKDIDQNLHAKVTTAFKNCESTPSGSDPCIYATSLVQCIAKQSEALGLNDDVADFIE